MRLCFVVLFVPPVTPAHSQCDLVNAATLTNRTNTQINSHTTLSSLVHSFTAVCDGSVCVLLSNVRRVSKFFVGSFLFSFAPRSTTVCVRCSFFSSSVNVLLWLLFIHCLFLILISRSKCSRLLCEYVKCIYVEARWVWTAIQDGCRRKHRGRDGFTIRYIVCRH